MQQSKKRTASAEAPTVILPRERAPYAGDARLSGRAVRLEGIVSSASYRQMLFLTVVLLLCLAYLTFTILSMVPQARAHFVYQLTHPSLTTFLKP